MLTPEQKKQLTGEGLFIRALSHFYLVNLFGDIPYIIQTDYRINSSAYKMPVSEVYDAVIKDLQQSISLLSTSYSGSTRVRPNKYTAKALLARTYLYNNMFAEASNEASSLLNQNNVFQLQQNLDQVFLINSSETIWQMQSANAGQNTLEGLQFIFVSAPPPTVALTNNLVSSFSPDDLRRVKWIKAVSNSTTTFYHSYKYKMQNNTASSVEYPIVFRLAEQYLIRAEARAREEDLIGAKEDLNKIRNRAGLPNTAAVSKQEILQAILKERRWELFSEYGHRFFDLKRYNELDSQLSPLKPGWKTTNALFPLPQNELITNPNLRPQNPGY